MTILNPHNDLDMMGTIWLSTTRELYGSFDENKNQYQTLILAFRSVSVTVVWSWLNLTILLRVAHLNMLEVNLFNDS